MLQHSVFLTIISVSALLFVLWSIQRWRESQYDLRGKTILLTGGSRGLGLAIARQLILQGARVAICARDAAELERAQAELSQQGEVLALPCDVTDRQQVNQMVETVRDRFGRIDVLINNAGTAQVGPFDVMAIEDFDESIRLHYWAPLYTTLAVLPGMRQRGQGRIVNISSIGGKVSVPHMLPYSASKFALVGLSEGMRIELALDDITVTTVCPGLIRTGSQANVFFKGQQEKEFNWFTTSMLLPFASMSAERAAQQTIAALKRGAPEVILGLSAQIMAKLHGLFPGPTTDLLGQFNRFLPEPDVKDNDRRQGKEIHPSVPPTGLIRSLDEAALRNNELGETSLEHSQVEATLPQIQKADVQPQVATASQPELTAPETSETREMTELDNVDDSLQPISIAQAVPEVQSCLQDIQDTMGIPWAPANWRTYANYPPVMELFWQRLRPTVETESFLRRSIAIAEQVYESVSLWYDPGYQMEIDEVERRRIQRELNAFSFGNPQLLIQQVALQRALQGEIVGNDETAPAAQPRENASAYCHIEIPLLDESAARKISEELPHIYDDIRQTLGVPLINSDYQALARWSAFFLAGWEDIKQWRQRQEYRDLEQSLRQAANEAANQLHPVVWLGEREVQDRLDNPEDFDRIQQSVDLFTQLLPGLIITDAMFHRALIGSQRITSASTVLESDR